MSRRIAIVEDEPAIRANYADALRKQGYDVVAYADRPTALAALRTRLPDLALIDIGLADDIDGGTITSHIKRIRQKVMALDAKFHCIATVYGMGYRWNPEDA